MQGIITYKIYWKIARGLNVTFRNLIEQTYYPNLLFRYIDLQPVAPKYFFMTTSYHCQGQRRENCGVCSFERNFWLFHWLNSNCRRLIITYLQAANLQTKYQFLRNAKRGRKSDSKIGELIIQEKSEIGHLKPKLKLEVKKQISFIRVTKRWDLKNQRDFNDYHAVRFHLFAIWDNMGPSSVVLDEE